MKYGFKEYKPVKLISGHLHMGAENPSGERIDVTNLYFTRGGKPWIGVMGEYHFSRDNADRWHEELCKMKAGGITIVSTYLFWIYHEEIEGEFDFTGDNDIRSFVQEAKKVGLDVIIRIGPWAHGECRNGGFPDWLVQKPYKIRCNAPEYMEKVRIWYTKIFEQVQGLFYQDGGNIIGIQFENELVDDAEHILALKKLALEIGFQAPLYTATGWNSAFGAKIPVDEVVPVFGAYAEAPWSEHIEPLPLSPHYVFNSQRNDSAIGADITGKTTEDGWALPYEKYPFATCELGSGIQPTHHRRIVVGGMDAYAMSLVKLGSGNNLVGYYMYHGGTNKIGKLSTLQESRATGYPNDYTILNYDFHTALSQYGEAREQHGLLNILHMFIQDFGSVLAPMESVESTETVDASNLVKLRYRMRTDGKSGFVFVNHYQRLAKCKDERNVEIDTGSVVFPKIDVCGDISFFMPFHMDLSGNDLVYATAQPLCRVGNTYFFAEIPGVEAQYHFADGETFKGITGDKSGFIKNDIRVITVSWWQAYNMRKLSGEVYIGDNCSLYEMDGKILAVEDGSFAYWKWNGSDFDRFEVHREFHQAVGSLEDVEEPFIPEYADELNLESPRKRWWKKIHVEGEEGFVEITGEYDAAQIYVDGRMVADNFFTGEVWRVPARLVQGDACYAVFSELKDDIYLEYKHFS